MILFRRRKNEVGDEKLSYTTVSIGPLIFRALSTRGPRPRVDNALEKGQYLCSPPLRAFSSVIGFSKLFFGVLRATTSTPRHQQLLEDYERIVGCILHYNL